MRCNFRGHYWWYEETNALPKDRFADVDGPHVKGRRKKLRVKATLPARQKLLYQIHEGLHACYPDLEEEAVDEGARALCDFLWKLGYRLLGG